MPPTDEKSFVLHKGMNQASERASIHYLFRKCPLRSSATTTDSLHPSIPVTQHAHHTDEHWSVRSIWSMWVYNPSATGHVRVSFSVIKWIHFHFHAGEMLLATKCIWVSAPSNSIREMVSFEGACLEALQRAGVSISKQRPNPKTDSFTPSPGEVRGRWGLNSGNPIKTRLMG